MAVNLLLKKGKHVVAIGNKSGLIKDVVIHKGKHHFDHIHTITLYINPTIQKEYYEYFLALKPKRIIFNPGTENEEIKKYGRISRNKYRRCVYPSPAES